MHKNKVTKDWFSGDLNGPVAYAQRGGGFLMDYSDDFFKGCPFILRTDYDEKIAELEDTIAELQKQVQDLISYKKKSRKTSVKKSNKHPKTPVV